MDAQMAEAERAITPEIQRAIAQFLMHLPHVLETAGVIGGSCYFEPGTKIALTNGIAGGFTTTVKFCGGPATLNGSYQERQANGSNFIVISGFTIEPPDGDRVEWATPIHMMRRRPLRG